MRDNEKERERETKREKEASKKLNFYMQKGIVFKSW